MNFKLIDSGWDRVLDEAVEKDNSNLRIVCPFIKKRVTERLLQCGRPHSLHVITRFNQRDFCNGVSDTSALRLLLEKGAKIRGIRNLHAKLYLFGQSRVIVTSANLTQAALLRNHEFGFVADDGEIIVRCEEYFDNLWQQAGADLTVVRLDGWEEKLSGVLTGGALPSHIANLSDEGVDAGLTETPFDIPPFVAEAPQSFVKFFGEGHNREDRATLVLDEVKRSGCHWACTYPKGKRPRQVEDGAVIFMGRFVKEPNDIIIYGWAVGVRHQEGRDDATPADQILREWKARWPHYIRVHHAEFVAGSLGNGIPLSHLMDELKFNAYASTKRNATKASGNINPRGAYMQQPAVKLSDEGFNWLNNKLETAFQTHGRLASRELEQLDWPELPS